MIPINAYKKLLKFTQVVNPRIQNFTLSQLLFSWHLYIYFYKEREVFSFKDTRTIYLYFYNYRQETINGVSQFITDTRTRHFLRHDAWIHLVLKFLFYDVYTMTKRMYYTTLLFCFSFIVRIYYTIKKITKPFDLLLLNIVLTTLLTYPTLYPTIK